MTIALVAVVVVALAVIVAQARVGREARQRAASSARRADAAAASGARAEEEATEAVAARSVAEGALRVAHAQIEELERQLAANLVAGIDHAPAGSSTAVTAGDRTAGDSTAGDSTAGVGPAAVLDTLWALGALERARERRQVAAVSTAVPGGPTTASGGLTEALDEEVGRLREDTGTPGTLLVELDTDPSPAEAVLLLRAVQSLLAILCRHCQAYDLSVHRDEDHLVAVLVCDDFDGPDSVADEIAELIAALTTVDGRIELDRDADERLRASLALPAPR